jgi:hypothetical protein
LPEIEKTSIKEAEMLAITEVFKITRRFFALTLNSIPRNPLVKTLGI